MVSWVTSASISADVEPPEIPRTAGVISLADGELDVTFPYDAVHVDFVLEAA